MGSAPGRCLALLFALHPTLFTGVRGKYVLSELHLQDPDIFI